MDVEEESMANRHYEIWTHSWNFHIVSHSNNTGTELEDPIEDYKRQLAILISQDDAIGVKNALDTYGGISLVDSHNATLVHLAVCYKSSKVLDVLLNTEGAPINSPTESNFKDTPLLYCMRVSFNDNLIVQLLDKGANIHARDIHGFSTLHYTVQRCSLKMSVLLIEKGIDINCRTENGETPLYQACEENWIEGICMLLSYGADPTIGDKEGRSAFIMASLEVREILSDYMYNNVDKSKISVVVLTDAVKSASPLLYKHLEHASEFVTGKQHRLTHGLKLILAMEPRSFRLFLTKCEDIMHQFIPENRGLGVIKYGLFKNAKAAIENWTTLLNSKFAPSLLQSVNELKPKKCNSEHCPILRYLVDGCTYKLCCGNVLSVTDLFNEAPNLDVDTQNELIHLISLLVSKGVYYNCFDVCIIYAKFGFDHYLFKQMITMEFDKIGMEEKKKDLLVELIYDVDMSLEKFLACTNHPFYYNYGSFDVVLEYFCDSKFKNFCSDLIDDTIQERLTKLPKIPSLAELAREATRKHLINFYKVQSGGRLIQIVNTLDIATIHKDILTYKRPLYRV